MNKEFKDNVLKGIVDAFGDECRNYLYEQLAQHGEDVVWALLLVDYLNMYKESQTEKHRRSVEALLTLMPDASREEIIGYIRHDYLRHYFDQSLIVRILTNDFPSRYALEQKDKACRGAGLQ